MDDDAPAGEWISVEVTKADWQQFNRGNSTRLNRFATMALLVWMMVTIVVLFAADEPRGYLVLVAFLVVVALLLSATSQAGRASFPAEVASVRISSAGFENRSRTHTVWRAWDEFTDVIELRDVICLRLSPRRAELVPRRSFPSADDAARFVRDARHWIARGPLETLDPSEAAT